MGKDLQGKDLGRGISQRKDGIFIARFYVEGKKSPICLYDKDINILREEFEKAKRDYENGIILNFENITVNEWFKRWISIYHTQLKNTSRQNYYTNYERIEQYIGYMKLAKLRQSHVQKAINALADADYAYTTILATKNLVYAMCQKAIENEYIIRNPCVGVVMPKKPNIEKVPLSKDMEQKFFEAISGQRYEELFRILLYTGMRIGEALALEWTDVDFEEKTITISKTLNRTNQYDRKGNKLKSQRMQITSPKKSSSNRVIPLLGNVELELIKWKKKQDKDKQRNAVRWGKDNYLKDSHPNLIFTTSAGNPLSPNDAWCYCNQGVNRINEEEIILAEIQHREPKLLILHPHIFRHTYATRCIESGMNPKAVQKLLGHATMDMLETYTHPSIDFLKNECREHLSDQISNGMIDNKKIVDFSRFRKSV